jgi:hypothetical protein
MTPAQMLLAIAATQAACPSDGDRSESVSEPDDGAWMSGRDSEWRAGVAEDRVERQWLYKADWEAR